MDIKDKNNKDNVIANQEWIILQIELHAQKVMDKKGITNKELSRRLGANNADNLFSGQNMSIRKIANIFTALDTSLKIDTTPLGFETTIKPEGETIIIARDFSKTPGPRYKSEGDNTGEEFREKILLPAILNAIKNNNVLYVDLDGANGYGVSFLDEAFGGLVRVNNISPDDISNHLRIKSEEQKFLIEEIWDYINLNKEKK